MRNLYLNKYQRTLFLLFIVSLLWGYGPDWLPYYANFLGNGTMQVLGSLDKYHTTCNEIAANNKEFCSDQYVIPRQELPVDLKNKSIGLGFITSEVIVGCLDETEIFSKLHVGEIQQNLKRVNAYRNYRVFNLDLFPCKKNLVIQAWVKPEDARHGLISGKVIVGETTAVESYHDLINYFINGILLMFAVMAIPLLLIMKWLRGIFKTSDYKKDLFLMITYWLITSLFISGLVMIVLPFSEAQSFYRRLLNIIFCFSRLVTLAYYTKQINEKSYFSKFLNSLIKSPFKTENLFLSQHRSVKP